MVLDENAEQLFEMYRYFTENLNIDTHSFQFLKGSSIQHADNMVEFEDILKKSKAKTYQKFDIIKEQLQLVKQYNLQKGTVSFLHPKVDSLTSDGPFLRIDYLNDFNHIKKRYSPCKFPWSSVHINVDGTLFPCLAVSMGTVKKQPLCDVISGATFTRFKNLIRKEGSVEACNRCGWLLPKQ
jgi:MoaA/NifB/PqqE/SkfB family radical SAM enzyme